MMMVSMLDAKTNLSRLVGTMESGAESEIIIARNGCPEARLVAVRELRNGSRIGVAKDLFKVPDTILDADNAIMEPLMNGGLMRDGDSARHLHRTLGHHR